MSVNSCLIKDRMLDRIAQSQAHFKSQQQGESDLTFDEKRLYSAELLERNVVLFLQRFHKFLTLEDLTYFDPHTESYEVKFYMEEARRENDSNKRKLKVKNRRYEAMQKLIKEGEYFSDNNMRNRMPLLYEQMIGQYQTDEERRKTFPENEDLTFSGFLMNTIEKQEEERIKKFQEEQENVEEEESDDSSLDEGEEEEEGDGAMQTNDMDDTSEPRTKSNISEEEKEMLRQEFTSILFQQFLSGKDQYDYRSIDDNTELDSHQMGDMDEEEKYFDSEDPS